MINFEGNNKIKVKQEYFGIGSLKELEHILKKEEPQKIFLVTGKNSYKFSGAKNKLELLLTNYFYIQFSDFSVNPKIEDIKKGIELYQKEKCDLVIAIGGGSVIDTAKAINLLSSQKKTLLEKQITGEEKINNKGKTLIAIPTTSGTGSEATSFAVVYINKTKYSLAHKDFMLPDYIILDPSLTFTLPKYITAGTGMDALCQAIEAYWSVNSTEESKTYSKEAIFLAVNNIENSVNNPTEENRIAMMKASNLAGKAINIAKTTACHAISYPITSYFNVPHGHAVALTLGEMVVYNSMISSNDCLDQKGTEYVKEIITNLNEIFGVNSPQELNVKFNELMESIGLNTKLSELGITSEYDINVIVKNGFNPKRVKNNPRKLTEIDLRKILERIM